jgi:hypothetical protein
MTDLKYIGSPPNPRAWPCIFKIILLVAVIGYLGEKDHQQQKQIAKLTATCERQQ